MIDLPSQSASGSNIAQADRGGIATVNIGLNSEQVASMIASTVQGLLAAAGSAAQARITELAAQLNTSREAVLGFLRTLKEDEVPTEQLADKLALIAQRYVSMMERLAALDPEDSGAQAYIDQAREVLRLAASTSDYKRADELLRTAENAQGEGLRRIESLEREAHEAASRKRRSMAAIRAERGELSLTHLDYLLAADHFRAAADLITAEPSDLKLYYLSAWAAALFSHGNEKGDNSVLASSIDAYRAILRVLPRTSLLQEWVAIQNNLGNAFWVLGQRESGTGKLHEAVSIYRETLKECRRSHRPMEWAWTQNNLGNALRTLGERESETERLQEAVSAYREALRERTRERVPLEWAVTQNNLGNALWTLGERETGTERLEEAVEAYNEALKEYTQKYTPLDWAMTQNNLGNAFSLLGARKAKLEYLKKAITAYNEALKERTRERVPLSWAMTQNNLGGLLRLLGECESGTEQLRKAIAAYRNALKERTRKRVPLDYAMTQNNLGGTLRILGEREGGTELLEEARVATQQSWSVYREAGIDMYDSNFKARIAAIDALLASRRST